MICIELCEIVKIKEVSAKIRFNKRTICKFSSCRHTVPALLVLLVLLLLLLLLVLLLLVLLLLLLLPILPLQFPFSNSHTKTEQGSLRLRVLDSYIVQIKSTSRAMARPLFVVRTSIESPDIDIYQSQHLQVPILIPALI